VARKPVFRVAAAVFGGVAVAVSLLGILAFVNADEGFAGCAATTALGWTIPLVAGGLVGLTSWLLLVERDSGDDRPGLQSSRCDACGSPVVDEWRLCPYCGHVVQAQAASGTQIQERIGARTGDASAAQ